MHHARDLPPVPMRKLCAAVSICSLVLAACQTSGDTQEPIKVGFIGPLTGEAAAYGVDPLAGVQLKVDEVNAAGGIHGRMLQLIAEDGKCSGADAASAAQKLVHVDKVAVILGGQCSGETLAASPIVEAASVVMMSSISSSPDVTNAGDFVFRNYPSDALKTKAMAAYFAGRGFTKIAIISENTDFAQGFRNALIQDVGAEKIVFDETVDPNTKDYRTLLARLQKIPFDVFVANGQFPASIAAMVQQMRELGMEQLVISHDVGDTAETVNIAGEAAEGLQVINVPSIGEDTDFGRMVAAKGITPQAGLVFMAHGYDAMGVIADALRAVGTEGTAIRDYLYALDAYRGVTGTFSFDDHGDVEGVGYVLKEVRNGAFVTQEAIPVE